MSISLTEIMVVFVVALLLFGPEQLPVIARGLGKVVHEFRKTSDSLRREFYNSVYTPAEEVRRDLAAEGRSLRALRAEVMAPPPGTAPAQIRPTAQGPVQDAPQEKTDSASTEAANTEGVATAAKSGGLTA